MAGARSRFLAFVMLFHAVALLAIAMATAWWSDDWMLMLIHLVGEERALGSDNVIVLDNGGKLLTNPGAMIRWMIPFWLSALVELSAAMLLGIEVWRRLARRLALVEHARDE